jgi:hypothetical protein
MSLSSGTRIGPYEVVAALGEGGMGIVLMRFGREAKTLVMDWPKLLTGALAALTSRCASNTL